MHAQIQKKNLREKFGYKMQIKIRYLILPYSQSLDIEKFIKSKESHFLVFEKRGKKGIEIRFLKTILCSYQTKFLQFFGL